MLTALALAACAKPAPTPPTVEAPTAPAAPALPSSLTVATDAGPVSITAVYHSAARIEFGETVLWLDPWSKANLQDAPKADIILITDTHFDHLDPEAIAAVAKEGTVYVAPKSVADDEKMAGKTVDHILDGGEATTLGAITITAVPMYNLVRGPEEGGVFHEKGRGNGYLLDIGGKRIYFAGDTECTDEMRDLQGVDQAFIPMNLPYTMTPEEAAICVQAFHPTVVTPYHYAGSDLDLFESELAGTEGVSVQRLEFYPGGLPW